MKQMLYLLLALCLAQGVQADEIASAPLYQASFTDLAGQPVVLEQLRGKVAVVNFWATWCPPCRKEIPDLIEAQEQYRERGVAFIGIAVEDNRELVQDFARAYGINYPLASGKEQGIALMQKLGNQAAGLPFTLVLDAQGNIVDTRRGPMSAARLEQALQAALASPGQAGAVNGHGK
jgi:thiol-disulfide isomerase/thioredoxin